MSCHLTVCVGQNRFKDDPSYSKGFHKPYPAVIAKHKSNSSKIDLEWKFFLAGKDTCTHLCNSVPINK